MLILNPVLSLFDSFSLFGVDSTFSSFCEDYVIPAMVASAVAVNKDLQWKPLNHKLLMLMRSAKKSIRILALKALHKLFVDVRSISIEIIRDD